MIILCPFCGSFVLCLRALCLMPTGPLFYAYRPSVLCLRALCFATTFVRCIDCLAHDMLSLLSRKTACHSDRISESFSFGQTVPHFLAAMDYRRFYLNALEEIDQSFSQPLSLYHVMLQKEVANIRSCPQFLLQWECFKNSKSSLGDCCSNVVLPYLKVLTSIMEYVLCAVGDAVAARYLGFSLDQFRKVQMLLVSKEPFHSIAVAHDLHTSDSNLLWILQRCFGPHTFKPLQLEAIRATLSQDHVICLFPTGDC